MAKEEYTKMNNIVRIGKAENIEKYFFSIIMRMNPEIYDLNDKCIIIQVKSSLLDFADMIVRRFSYAGLKEISRKKKELKGAGYTIPDGWEIILKKIPVLEMMSQEL